MPRIVLIGSGIALVLGAAVFLHSSSTRVFAQDTPAQDAVTQQEPLTQTTPAQEPPVSTAPAQTAGPDADARLDRAFREIQGLRTLVTAQASRITNLERSVRSLQDQVTTPAGNRWTTAAGWAEIRLNMSRADVEYILGPPRTADSVIDRQTLTYGTDAGVIGTVTLVDDRVAQVQAPVFKIVLPEPGR